jgi:hypothetical protein
MNKEKCCGNCTHHMFDEEKDEWYCNCPVADAFLSWTGYKDCCADFKERKEKPTRLSDRLTSEIERRSRAFRKYRREP